MTVADTLQIIRDVVVTVGAAVAAIAAWRGLNTWRNQMLGKERHCVAAETLRAAIRWRDAVRDARCPFVFQRETKPLSGEDEATLPDYGERYRDSVRAYTRRWSKVLDCQTQLETALVEAEMYLGAWASQWFSEILDLQRKLKFAIEDRLDQESRRRGIRFLEPGEGDRVLYGGGSSDEFGAKVAKKVDELHEKLRQHFA